VFPVMELVEAIREQFFALLWGQREGYVMVASYTEADRIAKNAKGWREKGFWWPDEQRKMLTYIDAEAHGRHVWFTPLLYDKPHRGKDDVSIADIVWADLDEVHPDSVTPSAPIVIESSPGRFQAIWRLDVEEPIPAGLASSYSRRIAEQYKHLGADTGGSDLAQLLRVPGTYNYKVEYVKASGDPPRVNILTAKDVRVPMEIFEALPAVQGIETEYEDLPEILDADKVIEKHRAGLSESWFKLFSTTPDDDWSRYLWRFLQSSFESGLSKQEVFSVAIEARCNKFKRDGYRPNLSLWWDVLRAYSKFQQLRSTLARFDRAAVDIPTLYDPEELSGKESFVDRYYRWATGLGDAAPQYHELSGFVVLAAILAGNIRIESSIGNIVPNIWAMILADTTTTRKSTAMDLATDLVESVPGCEDAVIATDGSMEGIFKAMSLRPGTPSIFKKDEFQGFIASVGRKDYMVGMLEGLTKLYDGRTMKRQLAKESITVHNPVFIMYAGGAKTKMYSLLGQEHVESGFLPRFMFVTAEGDVDSIKPIGPKTIEAKEVESQLRSELTVLRSVYADVQVMTLGGQATMIPPQIIAHPTQACWDRYAQLEHALMKAGSDSIEPHIFIPMLARFVMSTLKCATLLAAHRQEPKNETILVEAFDFVDALSHTTKCLPYMLEVISNVGRTAFEGDIQKVYNFVKNHNGCPSGAVMRNYRLSAREMKNILETLEGRGLVDIRQAGKGKSLWALID